METTAAAESVKRRGRQNVVADKESAGIEMRPGRFILERLVSLRVEAVMKEQIDRSKLIENTGQKVPAVADKEPVALSKSIGNQPSRIESGREVNFRHLIRRMGYGPAGRPVD